MWCDDIQSLLRSIYIYICICCVYVVYVVYDKEHARRQSRVLRDGRNRFNYCITLEVHIVKYLL